MLNMPDFNGSSFKERIEYYYKISKLISCNSTTIIVLRCSYYGSVVNYYGACSYIPPYYPNKLLGLDPEIEIVDPTGCGNAYLGALTAYISQQNANTVNTILNGCYYGSMAAALTLQQIGPFQVDNNMFNDTSTIELFIEYGDSYSIVKKAFPQLFQ